MIGKGEVFVDFGIKRFVGKLPKSLLLVKIGPPNDYRAAFVGGFNNNIYLKLSTSPIYFKPKIHKPNNPGRPIVSACSCPTELISSYLDKIMVPFVKSLPSHIKDTNHALQIFRDFTFSGENKFIFTMDITSLYTVIPNNEGLLALKFYFDKHSNKKPSSETLLRLAELVLTPNCFSFSNNHYQQINGVAMGTKMGPSYANLFVSYLENQFLQGTST